MSVHALWTLLAAALVFLMQAGFVCLESGLVRAKNAELVAMKNFVDWVLCNLFFFAAGFGLMFGPSIHGVVGSGLFALEDLEQVASGMEAPFVFFLFQLAFAGTAATIVSGAIAGRASFASYIAATAAMTLVVYPVIGHWAWGDALIGSNAPWLAALGFVDFAGSTVVHSTGAWFALAAAWMIGPRQARFSAAGELRPIAAGSFQFAALGALLLWVGWWGFNGGSTLRFDRSVAPIVLNTNLAGAAGAAVAVFHALAQPGRSEIGAKLIGGALGGLVAITASCHAASPFAAIGIGGVAGWIHNVAFDGLPRRLRIDDPVGAIAVHGFCGLWGTLAVALVLPESDLAGGRLQQLGIQALGAAACFAWAGGLGLVTCALIRRTLGLRIAPELERDGLDLSAPLRAALSASPGEEILDEEELRRLLTGGA